MDLFRFPELLAELRAADQWLVRLGLETRDDRLRQCIDVVARAAEGYEKMWRTGEPAKVGRSESYHFGIVEALELFQVYRAFRDTAPQVIHPLLKRALSGPPQPSLETEKNSDGRNTMFELALVADWKLRGGNVHIGEPDITLVCPDASFAFECKRPLRESGIRPSVKDAAEQVANKLTNSAAFGAVAISVTRVLDRGCDLFVVPGGENIGTHLLVDQVLFDNCRRWSRGWFDSRVVAVLLHASVAAVFSGQLARASSTVVWPCRDGVPAYATLSRAIGNLYGENAIRS